MAKQVDPEGGLSEHEALNQIYAFLDDPLIIGAVEQLEKPN